MNAIEHLHKLAQEAIVLPKVGDYVRTEDGIKKVLKYTYNEKYENGHCVWFDNKDYGILFTDEEVNKMKPSQNIIDLIEVGDYVNGHRISDIYKDINGKIRMKFGEDCLVLAYKSNYDNYYMFEEDIKSIVTKEQFEAMQYKVGD